MVSNVSYCTNYLYFQLADQQQNGPVAEPPPVDGKLCDLLYELLIFSISRSAAK